MLNDPKNNSNPAVFIGIFFREHLLARNNKKMLPAAVALGGKIFRTCMEWTGPAVTITAFCGAVMNLFIISSLVEYC